MLPKKIQNYLILGVIWPLLGTAGLTLRSCNAYSVTAYASQSKAVGIGVHQTVADDAKYQNTSVTTLSFSTLHELKTENMIFMVPVVSSCLPHITRDTSKSYDR